MGCASSSAAAASATPALAPVEEKVVEETLSEYRAQKYDYCFAKYYDLRQELGRGCFGQVRLCVNKTTHHRNAVKILTIANDKQDRKAALELKAWKQVGAHENVVTLLDSYIEAGKYYFVMERCCCSITDKFLMNGQESGVVSLVGAFHQVFLGLQHIHSSNVVHRDIKAPNLLVDSNGIVKIADFGLSHSMTEGGISGACGSAPFMSPEMVKGKCYGFETDIWSCGALMYYLIYGSYAYDAPLESRYLPVVERRRQMMMAIATDQPKPAYQPAIGLTHPSLHVRKFIKTVLDRHASTRPNAASCAGLISDTRDNMLKKSDGASSPCEDIASSMDSHTLSTACATDTITVISGVSLGDSSCPSPRMSKGMSV